MLGAMNEHPEATSLVKPEPGGKVVCPECGWDGSEAWRDPRRSAIPWRYMIPALCVIGFMIGLAAVVLVAGAKESVTYPLSWTPAFNPNVVKVYDVEAIASGTRELPEGERLADWLQGMGRLSLAGSPGAKVYTVGFAYPENIRRSIFERGLPIPFYTRMERGLYRDPLTLDGQTQLRTDNNKNSIFDIDPVTVAVYPRWRWFYGSLVRTKPPEEAGGVVVEERYHVLHWLMVPAIGAGVWMFLVGCTWAARVFGIRPRVYWWRSAVGLAAALVFAAVALGSRKDSVEVYPSFSRANSPNDPATGLPVYVNRHADAAALPGNWFEDVWTKAHTAQLDREIAAAILKHAPVVPDGALMAGLISESYVPTINVWFSDPYIPLLQYRRPTYWRAPDFGAHVPMTPEPGVFITRENAILRLALPSAPTAPYEIDVRWAGVALVILGAWSAWIVGRGGHGLCVWFVSRRRRLGGGCLRCGFDLGHAGVRTN